jgi:predicted nucleotidyltransferase
MREGTFIKTKDYTIFEVKGLVHPPNKIVAFPRFILDSHGNRMHENRVYKKIYSISERFTFLEQKYPQYVVHDPVFDEKLCEVPIRDIKNVYNPINRLKRLRNSKKLDDLEAAALLCLKILKETADVPWNKLGVSGSLLVGMHTEKSDIDPIVYGVENCRKVHAALRKLLEEDGTPFRRYSLKDLRVLFDFRSKDTAMSFEDFVAVESRKIFQGKFLGRDYFIRFVKAPGEVDEKYGEIHYSNVGYGKIEAVVVDDSEAIFTPCKYKIEDVKVVEGPRLKPIMEIVSFRGRFCEQARKDERVIAQGKIEHVKDYRKGEEYYRLLIGNNPADHMILKIGKVKP